MSDLVASRTATRPDRYNPPISAAIRRPGAIPLKIRSLAVFMAISLLSGCAPLVEKYFLTKSTCDGRVTDAAFQSGGCVTGVEYPAARKKAKRSLREAADQDEHQEEAVDPRFKDWVP
jgi:hypothetical protein